MQSISLFLFEISRDNKQHYFIFSIRNENIIFLYKSHDDNLHAYFQLDKKSFSSLSEQQKQELYLSLLKTGTIYSIPEFQFDTKGSSLIFFILKTLPITNIPTDISTVKSITSVLILQQTSEDGLKFLNSIPDLSLQYQTIDYIFLTKIFDVKLTDFSSSIMYTLYPVINVYFNKEKPNILTQLFFSFITKELIQKEFILHPTNIIFNVYLKHLFVNVKHFNDTYLSTNTSIVKYNDINFTSQDKFSPNFTFQDNFVINSTTNIYGGENFTLPPDKNFIVPKIMQYMANNCTYGPLNVKTIPRNTLLYSISSNPIITDDLIDNELWAFWDTNDLTRYRVNFYKREYSYRTLNVLKIGHDYHLLDLSDPNTILRLYCDIRGDIEFKHYLAYAFRIENDENKNIVRRTSQFSMDTSFVDTLKILYPEFEGFIYQRNDLARGHHNEIAIFKANNVIPLFDIKLNNINSLSRIDSIDRIPKIMMTEDIKHFLNNNPNIHPGDNYPVIISALTRTIIENNNNVYTVLRSIFKGYLSKPLEDDEEVIIGVNLTESINFNNTFRLHYFIKDGKRINTLTVQIKEYTERIEQYFNIKKEDFISLSSSQVEYIVDNILKYESEFQFN